MGNKPIIHCQGVEKCDGLQGSKTLVPTIESSRLLLRAFRQSDFDAIANFYANPMSSTYGGPCNREDAWRKFAVYPGHWALHGYGPWALEEKVTGTFVGLAGMWFPEGWIEPEITWALMPGFLGKGYATEGATRALQSAYKDFGWDTAVSVIVSDNAASIAVAKRMGAKKEGLTKLRGVQACVYRHSTQMVE